MIEQFLYRKILFYCNSNFIYINRSYKKYPEKLNVVIALIIDNIVKIKNVKSGSAVVVSEAKDGMYCKTEK